MGDLRAIVTIYFQALCFFLERVLQQTFTKIKIYRTVSSFFFYCVIVKYRRVLKSKKLKVFIFLITSSKPKDIKGYEAVHLDKRQQ